MLRNVPEGRCDRSLARSAWDSATPKEPSRRVRCDSCRCAHRFDDWSDGILNAKTENIYVICFPAYEIGRCEGRSIDRGRIIGLDSSNLSKPPKLCLATGLWRIQRWYLAGSGNGPLHRAAARTSSDTNLSRRVFSPSLRNTAHISTRNTSGISCARSYRTLRDGSFEGRFPSTSCQATIGVVPTGRACRHFATASSITLLSIFLLIGCGFRKLAGRGVESQAMAAKY